MRRSWSIAVALVAMAAVLAPWSPAGAQVCPGTVAPFPDVPVTHTFCWEIQAVSGSFDFMHGYSDGTFRPGAPMTRQAVASVMTELDLHEEPPPACLSDPFPDVPTSSPFCSKIQYIANAGLLGSYGDGTFRPTNAATRQSMIVMMYRSHESPLGPDPTCASKPFPDVDTSNPFCGEIAWAESIGATEGYADGTFRPAQVVSRQAFAFFVLHTIIGDPHP